MIQSDEPEVIESFEEPIKTELHVLSKPTQCIVDAQENKREEQQHKAVLNLFFSFDIVNSTKYKTLTSRWPTIIKELLEKIRKKVVENVSEIPGNLECTLWRVIGDEMVFVLSVYNEQQITEVVARIFMITQDISKLLSHGDFYDSIEEQGIPKEERTMLKSNNQLSIKAAAWLAALNDRIEEPYDNISFCYDSTSARRDIQEFLGTDIDTGFRLKQYTQDRRLVISIELAYFMIEARKHNEALVRNLGRIPEINDILYIMDYVRLKGVWNDGLYPIIWYHNEQLLLPILAKYGETVQTDFESSFRYDETENNTLVKNYFNRKAILEGKSQAENTCDSALLHRSMYKVDSALPKIIQDRNLNEKLRYMCSLLDIKIPKAQRVWGTRPLELHCTVVCCDVEKRKILIAKRANGRSLNPGKWEFGCAKITSERSIRDIAKEYYKTKFDLDIELVSNCDREEVQPRPVAIYEIENKNDVKKGIIIVAKVKKASDPESFRPTERYEQIRWISEEQIGSVRDEDAVTDFKATLRTVFENFDTYFPHRRCLNDN